MSSEDELPPEALTTKRLKETGYREYRISYEALKAMVIAGSDLIIRRRAYGPFQITDTNDADWIKGLHIEDVEAE